MRNIINEISNKVEKLTLRMDDNDKSIMELVAVLNKHNQVLNYIHEELVKLKGVEHDGEGERQHTM